MSHSPSVLLMITGSIAAVKSLDIIRQCKAEGIAVTCVLTKGGEAFVTPLSCASLTGNRVYTELFSAENEAEMDHIALSRRHDLLLIAPASADILAKMAHGLADDLASTLLLATNKPVMVAPAMNGQMWQHKATQRNVKQLREDGILFCEPTHGIMACGEEGVGRMAEPQQIVSAVKAQLGLSRAMYQPLAGKRALVTSGPTRERIDPVRYISNHSSGKQGYAVAQALHQLGADVTLVSGPTSQQPPAGVTLVPVESAVEMLEACERALPVDIAVCAAAVADWRSECVSMQKIKKDKSRKDNLTFTFAENPDILVAISKHHSHRPPLVIGFAAETEHVVENARVKLEQKGCDWIVANDVMDGDVFDSDDNTVHLISAKTQEDWPKLTKRQVAEQLSRKIAEHFHADITHSLESKVTT